MGGHEGQRYRASRVRIHARCGATQLPTLVDAVLISEREGVRKPNPEIFRRAVARLGVEVSQTWFIGDNPDDDVAGAIAVGLRTFWRECLDWATPTVACEVIRSLDELLPLVSEGH